MACCNLANVTRYNSKMPHGRFTATLLVVSVSFGAVVNLGCQHQDLAERQARMRRDNIARTVSAIVRSEASRPARIERTIAAIDRRMQRDAQNTALNGERVGNYIERNFRRWRERQRDYGEGINRHFLRRRPENIEPTAIILFR